MIVLRSGHIVGRLPGLISDTHTSHGSQVHSIWVEKKYPLGLSSLLHVTNNDKRLINYHDFRTRPLQTIIIH